MRYHGKHLVFSAGRSKERKITSLGVSGGRLKLRSTTDWDSISSNPRSCTAVMLQGNYHTQNCCRSRNISITNPGALLLTHKAMISNSSLHIEDLENGWSPSQQYKRLLNLVIRKQFPFLQEMQFFFSDWAYIFTCSSSGLGTTAHFFFLPSSPYRGRKEGKVWRIGVQIDIKLMSFHAFSHQSHWAILTFNITKITFFYYPEKTLKQQKHRCASYRF